MPNETLTRRPDPHRSDCWLIYLGDVHVGPRRRHTWSRRAMGMVLRILSRLETGRANPRHRGQIRSGPRRLRASMDDVFGQAHQSRLRGVARAARLDRTLIISSVVGFTFTMAQCRVVERGLAASPGYSQVRRAKPAIGNGPMNVGARVLGYRAVCQNASLARCIAGDAGFLALIQSAHRRAR